MKKSLILTGVAVLVVFAAGLALWGVKSGQDKGSGDVTPTTFVSGGGGSQPAGGERPDAPIGGERDEHGCLIPAGFAWNQTAEKCMRPWNGEAQSGGGNSSGIRACTKEALVCPDGSSVGRDPENNCQFTPCPERNLGGGELIGGQRDEHGCLIPAGYSWNETAGKCMRPWNGEAQVETHVCTEVEKQNNACTMEYRPVCGSDAVTYGNGCSACSSKVDSWTEGECRNISRVCGECPQYLPPAPGWCGNGTIVAGKLDACGCRGPPQCVRG